MSEINFNSSSPEYEGRFVSDNCDDLVVEVVGNTPPKPSPAFLVPFLIAEREKIARWKAILEEQEDAKKAAAKRKDNRQPDGGEQP